MLKLTGEQQVHLRSLKHCKCQLFLMTAMLILFFFQQQTSAMTAYLNYPTKFDISNFQGIFVPPFNHKYNNNQTSISFCREYFLSHEKWQDYLQNRQKILLRQGNLGDTTLFFHLHILAHYICWQSIEAAVSIQKKYMQQLRILERKCSVPWYRLQRELKQFYSGGGEIL